jgi:methylthioribose-1-phosphate isomerase
MVLPLLTRRGRTLYYDRTDGRVMVLDRRRYPNETVFVPCYSLDEVANAITTMVVQGGPPLAYVAGYGLALAARSYQTWPGDYQRVALIQAAESLRYTRPTADDLNHILNQALRVADDALLAGNNVEHALADFVEAQVAHGDKVAEACGRHAATILSDGDTILTHCFAGAALNWMLFAAYREQGKQLHLYVNETRPYFQGARLTAHQAFQIGVRVTLLTDNMAGFCFQRGKVTRYMTAADRIALDGSIANKIGTYQYAVVAARHTIPFSVLGYDGPDPATPDGASIPIEERDPTEVLQCNGQTTAPPGVEAYYPAFDVTPPDLITHIITERGIFQPGDMATYHQA